MSRLKVAIVTTKRDWHGGEEQMRQLVLGLRERDHDCQVLAPRSSEMVRRLAGKDICLVPLVGKGRNPAAIWTMRSHLARFQPHVLHFNDPHALTAAGLASLGLGIPARVVSRRVQFALRHPGKYRFFADRVLCVSREVARVSAQRGMPDDYLRLVYDGVDPRRLRGTDREGTRDRLDIAAGQSLVLNVARMTPEKGHRSLLDSIPAVLARHPHTVFALVGDGPLRPELEQQAAQLGIAASTRFLGYRRDVPDLLAACDLFVFPSQREGLGSTLIETMLAQRPIVASSAGGIPDLVGPGPNGEAPVGDIVPPGDSRALADAISRALADPERSARMAQRGCDRARSHFTTDHMVEATLAVYRELLSAAGHGPAIAPRSVRAA
jgi:glycosyltransferase involved in cell wall biosynthesis